MKKKMCQVDNRANAAQVSDGRKGHVTVLYQTQQISKELVGHKLTFATSAIKNNKDCLLETQGIGNHFPKIKVN